MTFHARGEPIPRQFPPDNSHVDNSLGQYSPGKLPSWTIPPSLANPTQEHSKFLVGKLAKGNCLGWGLFKGKWVGILTCHIGTSCWHRSEFGFSSQRSVPDISQNCKQAQVISQTHIKQQYFVFLQQTFPFTISCFMMLNAKDSHMMKSTGFNKLHISKR